MDEEAKKVLARLQRLCSRAEYCRDDIYRKALKALASNSARASEVTEALVKDRFVDNARYASAFAREKASITGWGPVKIRFALAAKHISSEDIALALEDCDESKSAEKLEKLIAAKGRSLKDDPQIKLKLIKYALCRGYEYDEVDSAVKNYLKSPCI